MEAQEHLKRVKELWASGQHQNAVNECQKALSIFPQHLDTRHFYALMLNAAGRVEDAFQTLKNLCERPDAPPIVFQDLGRILMAANNADSAQKVLQFALQRFPQHAAGYRELGLAMLKNREPLQAIEVLEKGTHLERGDWSLWQNLGMAYAEIEKPNEAVQHFDRALKICGSPGNLSEPFYTLPTPNDIAGIKLAKSDSLNQAGRIEESRNCVLDVLASAPENTQAWYALSNLMHFNSESPELQQMENLAKAPSVAAMPVIAKQYLNFALGKAWRDAKSPENAMKYYDTANRLRRADFNYDNEAACLHLQHIKERYPAACFRDLPAIVSNKDSADILFVIGMPRCGSTLTEQILSSHPHAHGAGELLIAPQLKQSIFGELFPFTSQENQDSETQTKIQQFGREYRQQLEQRLNQRGQMDQIGRDHVIVDKMLGNFMWVGLILQAIPNARFIHCTRNAVDTCLSAYTLRFSSGHPYCFDQSELGSYYKAYEDLMAHWHNVVPEDRLLKVSYESIVANTESEAKRIIEFAGLTWTDKVLSFHKTRRAVRTASFDQVNKPIYLSSVERWKPYAPWLRPLLQSLGHTELKEEI